MTSKRLRKVLIIILLVITLTGCTKVLKDKKTNKVVYYENDKVKITLNENILCKPEDKGLVKNIINIKNK